MTQRSITILHLYPKDMNIYGDMGNILTVKRRLEWYGYTPHVVDYNPGDRLPEQVDIVIGGGGQDSGQDIIHEDLVSIQKTLQRWADEDVPMLMVCGLYQLFGKFFKTASGHVIKGINILDVETHGGSERLIGNIVATSDEFGDIIGYENHSGQTTLGEHATPLAQVIKGAGNNSSDGHEGARYRNVIGTYLHGSLLPKNPRIADFLIKTAITRKFGEFEGGIVDDLFSDLAREVARERPR